MRLGSRGQQEANAIVKKASAPKKSAVVEQAFALQ
jgi:hypothetical protein